jgi:hypothetical protein
MQLLVIILQLLIDINTVSHRVSHRRDDSEIVYCQPFSHIYCTLRIHIITVT